MPLVIRAHNLRLLSKPSRDDLYPRSKEPGYWHSRQLSYKQYLGATKLSSIGCQGNTKKAIESNASFEHVSLLREQAPRFSAAAVSD